MRQAGMTGWCVAGVCLLGQLAAAAVSPTELVEAPTTTALAPPDISEERVELSGKLAYFWTLPDGTKVIQYEGNFGLDMGPPPGRRLRSRDAVIWMRERVWQNRRYLHFEVFLWRDARVIEPAGTVTSGPVLFVTLNTFDMTPTADADTRTFASSEQTPLYQRAAQVRAGLAGRQPPPGEPAGAMQVIEPEAKPVVRPPRRPRRPVTIRYGGELVTQVVDNERTMTVTGGVYIAQSGTGPADLLEIRADSAVLFAPQEAIERGLSLAAGATSRPAQPQPAPPGAEGAGAAAPPMLPAGEERASLSRWLSGAYLEGDVVLTRGERMIRANRLYYDFQRQRALILDAVMRVVEPTRNLPIYVRARQVRQLSESEYLARDAKITTSEFYTPHYHVGAEKVYLYDRTPRDERGEIIGVQAGTYKAYNTTLNIEGVPVAYWPYTEGDFRRSETSLRSVRVGYSDDFGFTFETKWYLFNLLGLDTPEGYDAKLSLDYFTERGPGVGIDLDYVRDDYYGLVRSYYIYDTGEDNLGPFRDNDPDTENRGRFLFRHRHYLPKDWELTLELSYISDPAFLEEYFEQEFDQGKEQETLIYLKKQKHNWAFTTLAQWRILDFLTQTEHLPDLAFHWIGQPLGELASFFSETHLGLVRYRPDDRRLFDRWRFDNTAKSHVTFRGDTRNEIDVPIKLGDLNVVPFAMIRAGGWSESPHEGSIGRIMGSYGVRSSMYFWRLFENVQSRLLDLNGIRHVIQPDLTAWVSHSNTSSDQLYPFDEGIEDIDEFDGITVGLRQRWQTKRGGPGRWRVVDWITLDLELGVFNDAQSDEFTHGDAFVSRPEDSITRNFINANFIWRISDSTALLSDANWDMNDGEMDTFNISLAVERTPRFSYFLGWRYIREIDSSLLGFGANYRISRKHTIAFREYFDLDRGETLEFRITYIRKLPRWYVAASFDLDKAREDFGISLSAWPEGVPEWTVGSKRYTGLATSTGIRP